MQQVTTLVLALLYIKVLPSDMEYFLNSALLLLLFKLFIFLIFKNNFYIAMTYIEHYNQAVMYFIILTWEIDIELNLELLRFDQ